MTRLEIAVALRCAAIAAGPTHPDNRSSSGDTMDDFHQIWNLKACFEEAEQIIRREQIADPRLRTVVALDVAQYQSEKESS